MDTLKQNITHIYGKRGEKWIANLPVTIEMLAHHWLLSQITPVNNMTYNYVAKAIKDTEQPVILKISCNKQSMAAEQQALLYFNGQGSIKLLDENENYHALLLQQALPGNTLKSLYPMQIPFVMDCYVDTMQKLHAKRLPDQRHYLHISEWLKSIDQLKPNHPCPSHLLKKAIVLKNALLASMTTAIFLHGDLHHDNILKNDNHWLAIDPKGIIGEPEFEVAAFDFMYVQELAGQADVKNIFESRINLLAQKANLNAQRIKDWVFVRLILMAAWNIEDHGDSSWAIKLAEQLG
ncbi:MAG: phosphotransferase [Gammaproteobacteria bacterium]|nr:phosphotransferase [Gammaproteobacteria bacterium]